MKKLLILCSLLLATAVWGKDLDLIHGEVRIAPGKTHSLQFGTVPQADSTILLTVTSRMDSPGLGGSMYFMELTLNGRQVLPAKSRTVCRLTNRPFVSPVAPSLPAPWHGSGGWRILYAPDFEAAKRQSFYAGDPYTLVLDVTDLTNPAAENRLEIANTATSAFAKRLKSSLDLVIKTVTVTVQPGASPTMTPGTTLAPVINHGEPGGGPAPYRGELLPGGGFAITVQGKRLTFDSRLSYPNAGFNHLTADGKPDTSGQPGWKVATAASASGGSVTATGPDYRIRREVRFTPRRVEVADTITNAHADAPLGLIVQDDLQLRDYPDAGIRIAGNPDPSINDYYAPANPSVCVTLGDLTAGMICEDDVFRNQARLFFDTKEKVAGLRTEMLCLAPGGSYTLRWAVYPVASRDYYDFINLVRQDWGSNYTVEGAWSFFGPDQILAMPLGELRQKLERLGVRCECLWGGWVDRNHDPKRIGFGSEVLSNYWADYRSRIRQAVVKLHEAEPGLKAILYYDTQRDTHADAGKLYPDSKLTDVQGNQLSTDWSGIYSLTWSMVATVTDSFGKDMLKVVDAYMDDMGADGVYWDEMENVAYGVPLLTYSQPDGHSCILDPKTYTIQHQVGVTTLLGEKHRLAVIDRIRAKGGTLMGNGPTTTRALLAAHVQRMVEIQHNDYWAYEGNLDTPLGYASSRRDFGNVTRGLGMATLLVGTSLDYPYDISKYLFPFTPIELHYGYLLGKERIITMNSGHYGWVGETVPCILRIFDATGKLRLEQQVTAGPGKARVNIDLKEGEVAVLARQSADAGGETAR